MRCSLLNGSSCAALRGSLIFLPFHGGLNSNGNIQTLLTSLSPPCAVLQGIPRVTWRAPATHWPHSGGQGLSIPALASSPQLGLASWKHCVFKSAVGTSVSNFQAILMVRIWVQVVYVGSNPRKCWEGPSTGRQVRKGTLMGVSHQWPWAMGLSH